MIELLIINYMSNVDVHRCYEVVNVFCYHKEKNTAVFRFGHSNCLKFELCDGTQLNMQIAFLTVGVLRHAEVDKGVQRFRRIADFLSKAIICRFLHHSAHEN
jgi:hypothetical protein